MAEAEKKPEPIRQSVHVDCPIEEAFRLFTESFGEWWPADLHSLSGDEAPSCEMEPWRGGKIIERAPSGEERECGEVSTWEPPERLVFTLAPGRQSVDVRFRVEADGTRVTLIHTGWEAPGTPVCAARFAACAGEHLVVMV